MEDNTTFDINDWEIETIDGWKSFKGIEKYENKECILLKLEDLTELKCSPNHELMDKDGNWIYAKDTLNCLLKTKEGNKKVISIEPQENQDLYDVLDVEGGHFIANKIVSHNCGLLREFWSSVFPIISSKKKSKIIMASTPRDTSGLFYKLYDGSVKKDNDWANMKILWSDVPGRDEKWKRDMIGSIGDPAIFKREFECTTSETRIKILNNDNEEYVTIGELFELCKEEDES